MNTQSVLEDVIIKYHTQDVSIENLSTSFKNIKSYDLVTAIRKLNERYLFPSFKALLIELICCLYEHIINDNDGCTFDESYTDFNRINRILKIKLESLNQYENLVSDLKLFKKFYLFYSSSSHNGFCESGINYSSVRTEKLMAEYKMYFKYSAEQPTKFFKDKNEHPVPVEQHH